MPRDAIIGTEKEIDFQTLCSAPCIIHPYTQKNTSLPPRTPPRCSEERTCSVLSSVSVRSRRCCSKTRKHACRLSCFAANDIFLAGDAFRGGVWVSNAASVFCFVLFSVQIVPLEEAFKDATKISVSLISHHLSAGTKQSRYQRQLNGFLMRNLKKNKQTARHLRGCKVHRVKGVFANICSAHLSSH